MEKARAVDVSSNRNSERPPRKCFRCGYEDHMIKKCPKPPKDNEKRQRQVCFNEKGNRECDNGENDDDLKIYASMAQMSSDDKRKSIKHGDSSQLTNWILDLGATCHMTPEVSDFIPGTLEDTDKYIEVADGHHVTAKQKGRVQIKMCDDNGKPFIATLHNVLLAPDLCDRLFPIIMLMNSGHTYIFHKGFCTVYFGAQKKNAVTLPHSAQRKHTFLGKIMEKSKKNELPARNKKEKAHAVDILDNRQTERTPRKCFRCGSEDHMIAKCPKPPKDNEKRRKQVLFNEKVNRACNNGEKK